MPAKATLRQAYTSNYSHLGKLLGQAVVGKSTMSRLALVCMLQVLKPFLDSGQLDMAIFDAVNDTTIKLSRSGVLLGPGTCVNPVCIVANYLFDTLCHDIFQVSGLPVCLPFSYGTRPSTAVLVLYECTYFWNVNAHERNRTSSRGTVCTSRDVDFRSAPHW